MCLGTLSVLYPVNLLFLRLSFTQVYGFDGRDIKQLGIWITQRKNFYPFFSVEHPTFWTLNFRKGYYKTVYVNRSVNMSGGQLLVFLKKDSKPFLKFYIKLEHLKGKKLIKPIYFCFLKEFLLWRKRLTFPLKQGFLTFAKN